LRHRHLREDRGAEVAGEQLAQPQRELLPQRQVQPERGAQLLDVFGGGEGRPR